ncbi:MOSC domain-containing protein [uncultured Tenacibaculum sp.]|uniref:MOSC domain-containing protein n=1 Tax=uncultured Tenacibaculum sp. TaxID=174713 RepID=UPI00260BA2B4|nr:MOSC domain-containing protein [uncultured Tenacibaculum sp.]
MKIIATSIGERKEVDWKGKTITTGIFKFPVEKAIYLDVEEIKGDAICNRESHGGVDQAVYGYSQKHYEYWKEFYPDLEWQHGMFGENLTIDDLDETKIHVGDTYKVGEAILEVTKPREPCMKLGVRFNNMKIVKQFWQQNYSGIYFKVLETGFVKSGDQFTQIKSCTDAKTIAEVYNEKRIKNKS